MKGVLLAVASALLSGSVMAQPPLKGATHTFVDPIFVSTVFCDTYFEVLAIATAANPADVFTEFTVRRNVRNEPSCAATIIVTGQVLSVQPLGVMTRDGKRYNAWAVEAQVGSATGFALYLEARKEVLA